MVPLVTQPGGAAVGSVDRGAGPGHAAAGDGHRPGDAGQVGDVGEVAGEDAPVGGLLAQQGRAGPRSRP